MARLSLILGMLCVGVCLAQDPTTTPNPIFDPEATIDDVELGRIQGLSWLTYSPTPRKFHVFHGIPYAEDTSLDGRFKASKLREGPLTPDGSTFPALNPLIGCPQGGLFRLKKHMNATGGADGSSALNANLLFNAISKGAWKWNGEDQDITQDDPLDPEDCLVLNINTPRIPQEGDELMPVIFFVHGGSSTQMWGAPFMGHKFMNHDVVLVTINYRLGVLGALNLGIDDAPGNAMMYDTVTALEWVQKHIHKFGGDKDRVVAYGHSAGGMMVGHLVTSPLAKGKLAGVIGASGSNLAPWGTAEVNSLPHHLEICFNAGCYPEWATNPSAVPDAAGRQAIYECMKEVAPGLLVSALGKYSGDAQRAGGLGFDGKVPSVQNSEYLTGATKKFLPKLPAEIMAAGEQNPINLIMGAMRHDGSFAFEDIYDKYLVEQGYVHDKDWMRNDLLPMLIKTMKGTDRSGAFQHILAQTYFGDAMKNGDIQEMIPGLIDVTSIWGFKAPAWELVQKQAKVNPNSFYYSFDFEGFWTTCDISGDADIPCGIPHIDDMSFTFQIFPIINEDWHVSNRIVQYFVNFAKFGTPNDPSEGDGLLHWDAYDPMTHPYLSINAEDSIGYECRDSWINNGHEAMPK